MSILGPLLFAAMMIIPAWLAQLEETDVKKIAVVDSSHLFMNVIPETEFLKFDYLDNASVNTLKENYKSLGYYGILYISHIVTYDPNSVILYSDKQPSLATKMHISKYMEEYIRDQKLKTYNIENLDEILKGVKTTINVRTIKITEEGQEKESSTGIMMAVGYISGYNDVYVSYFLRYHGYERCCGRKNQQDNRGHYLFCKTFSAYVWQDSGDCNGRADAASDLDHFHIYSGQYCAGCLFPGIQTDTNRTGNLTGYYDSNTV